MPHRPQQSKQILDAGKSATPFCSELGQPFVLLPVGPEAQQVVPLYSDVYRNWVTDQFYKIYEQPPCRVALREAVSTLHAQAACAEFVSTVPTRIGYCAGKVFLDLGDDARRIVEIDRHGWRVRNDLSRTFRHNRNARALPEPVEPPNANALQQLRSIMNIRCASAWTRILIWVTAALRPAGPYPALVLHGPPASGKSTLLRVLRSLIDPGAAPSCPYPTRVRELQNLAAAHWVLAFDHVEKLRAEIDHTLARLATGEVVTVRDRIHDPEGFHVFYQRPILLACAEPLPASSALIDRCLTVGLDAIQAAERRPERNILRAVAKLRPALLGVLCTAVSAALANVDSVGALCQTRFADAALWVAAASPALGLSEEAIAEEFQPAGNPAASAIQQLLAGQPEWMGSASELLSALKTAHPAQAWPTTPKGLSQLLRRTPIYGVKIETPRNGTRRVIRLSRIDASPSAFRQVTASQDSF